MLSISLQGCSDESESLPRDSIVIAMQSNPTSLDPRLATDAISSRVIDLMFNGLFRSNHQGCPEPDLVQDYEMPDKTTYLLKLRRDVVFQNGTGFTARDVKFTLDSIIDPKTGSRKRASYKNVEAVDVIDNWTVKIKLKEPQASFLETLKIGIVPQDYARSVGDEFANKPVGTGPFRLIEWQRGSKLRLERHDSYFRQRPAIRIITCKIVPDTSTRLLELQKGSVDFVQNEIPPESVSAFRQDKRFSVLSAPSSTYKYIGFNMRHPILSKRKVRQAMAYAINRKTIVDNLLLGQATLSSGLLDPGNTFYEPDVTRYEFDPQRARQILDEAGYPLDSKTGHRFAVSFKTSKDQRANQIAQIVQQQLDKVGIKIEIRSLEWATFYSDIIKGNFHIYSLSWVGISDPDFYFDVFNSQSFPPNGANRGHYSNAEIDRLTELGRVELDVSKRTETYSKIQKIIASDVPYISLWHPQNIAIMTSELEGFSLYPAGDFKSFERARLKQ